MWKLVEQSTRSHCFCPWSWNPQPEGQELEKGQWVWRTQGQAGPERLALHQPLPVSQPLNSPTTVSSRRGWHSSSWPRTREAEGGCSQGWRCWGPGCCPHQSGEPADLLDGSSNSTLNSALTSRVPRRSQLPLHFHLPNLRSRVPNGPPMLTGNWAWEGMLVSVVPAQVSCHDVSAS